MRLLALALLVSGCGGGSGVASAQMSLTASGLSPSDVGAVEILVLDGAGASCARALAGGSPLDDPTLQVVAHALFTISGDGSAKHLGIPANRALVFYAEAFRSPAPPRQLVGRGCAEQSLAPGVSSSVSITISATD